MERPNPGSVSGPYLFLRHGGHYRGGTTAEIPQGPLGPFFFLVHRGVFSDIDLFLVLLVDYVFGVIDHLDEIVFGRGYHVRLNAAVGWFSVASCTFFAFLVFLVWQIGLSSPSR